MEEKEVEADLNLVEKFIEGSEESFEELIKRYSTKVYNLAFRLTKNAEDAEEVLQDVFSTVFRKVHRFEGKSAFSSWIYRVTMNAAFMKLRKRRRQRSIYIDDLHESVRERWVCKKSEENSGVEVTYRNQLREALEKSVLRLPQEYRGVFVLRDINGLTNKEVGKILGLSLPAVKSRLHRARHMLKRRLKAYFNELNPEEAELNTSAG